MDINNKYINSWSYSVKKYIGTTLFSKLRYTCVYRTIPGLHSVVQTWIAMDRLIVVILKLLAIPAFTIIKIKGL